MVLESTNKNTRVGFIYFETNRGKTFKVGTKKKIIKDEKSLSLDVSGQSLMGVYGRCGWEVDNLGMITDQPKAKLEIIKEEEEADGEQCGHPDLKQVYRNPYGTVKRKDCNKCNLRINWTEGGFHCQKCKNYDICKGCKLCANGHNALKLIFN